MYDGAPLKTHAMNDRDVRKALKSELLREHESGTVMLEEMAIPLGATRIDVAIVNGMLQGYEIKSEQDTLARLTEQSTAYDAVFERLTLVVAERHLRRAVELVPEWWGIRVARWKSGSVIFRDLKMPTENPKLAAHALVRLLWKSEALSFLAELEGGIALRTRSRKEIQGALVGKVRSPELCRRVRECLKARQPAEVRASCDG